MTADHETHGTYDGADALMAAITGEEPPAQAGAAFLAEHRGAEADLALLREQLGIIGDALAGQPPRPRRTAAPVRAPRTRRPARRFALAGLWVAAAAALSGTGWLLAQAGGGMSGSMQGGSSADKAQSSARSPFASPGYLACARLVAEGDVTAVRQLPGASGQERITLHVTRAYKPAKTRPEVTFVIEEGAVDKALHKGDHVLVALPRDAATPDYVLVGEGPVARERAGIVRALPESAGVSCE